MVTILLPFSRMSASPQNSGECVEKSASGDGNFSECTATNPNDTVNNKTNNNATMMSPKRWILLLIFYISYLMFGASIYFHIEHKLEYERRLQERSERVAIHGKCQKTFSKFL